MSTLNIPELTKILDFLHIVEKLKFELRHSWLSNGRQESVAEHSWRMSLMVMLLAPQMEEKIDTAKAVKMALIHDIVEAESGDVFVLECQTKDAKAKKRAAEEAAIEKFKGFLKSDVGDEIYELWYEFEEKQTAEAKFVTALDKLEVFIQHNEASLDTWLRKEKHMIFQDKWKNQHCEYSPVLKAFNQLVDNESLAKFTEAGEDIESLREEALTT